MTGGFGNPNNKNIRALVEFNGYLYAITSNGRDGGEVHRSPTGESNSWEKVVDQSFRAFGNRRRRPLRSLHVFNGSLFVGTGMGAQIWRSEDGVRWRCVVEDGFGQGLRNFSVRALEVFNGHLFAGTGAEFFGSAGVYSSAEGDIWQRVACDGFRSPPGNNIVYALGRFDNHLYAGTFNVLTGAAAYRTRDGRSWQLVAARGLGHRGNLYIYQFCAYQPSPAVPARLVVTTGGNPRGGEAWAFDGQRWSMFAPKGFGKWRNSDLWAAGQFGDDFYIGTWKYPIKRAHDNGAELWRLDGATGQWHPETTDGMGNPDNDGIRLLVSWRGALYASLHNRRTGAELWRGEPEPVDSAKQNQAGAESLTASVNRPNAP